jgi:glycosyltransferase involved in cell wall biosynthesis
MKILFLSRWFPFPTNNGSKLRIYNLLRGLSQHHDVTLLGFSDQPPDESDAEAVRSICSEVYIVPWREFNPGSLRAKLGFLSLKPRSIIDTYSPEMAKKITQLLIGQKFDLVIASQIQMAAYYPYYQNTPAIFEELEIGYLHDQAFSIDGKIRLRHAVTWFKFRMYLARLLKAFRAVTVVSEQEKNLLSRYFPQANDVFVLPNCINLDDYKDVRAVPKPNTLIFTGSFRFPANYEAMQWFIGEVFPLVLAKIPSAELIITGDHANLPLPSLQNVTLAGYVDDIKTLIASSTVALAPLWSGGGTRLKILEAMAIGTPVVATSKGAEGLEAVADRHLLVADDPAEFAERVVQVLSDPNLRSQLTENARHLVRGKYDWQGVLPGFLWLLERVIRR